jgi:hypothetical protein
MDVSKAKPIIFSDEMVRAILDGRKTQTQRVIEPQPQEDSYCSSMQEHQAIFRADKGHIYCGRVPKYSIGDTLWVREAFCFTWGTELKDAKIFEDLEHVSKIYHYRAVGESVPIYGLKWRSAIHMPKKRPESS